MDDKDDMFFSEENPFFIEERKRLNDGYNRMFLGMYDGLQRGDN